MHMLHFIVRVTQIRKVPDSDLGWEDLYREDEGEGWFDWVCVHDDHSTATRTVLLTDVLQTTPVTIFLILASIVNAFYLFTRTKLYQLNLATDPVASPHAKFVRREETPPPTAPPRRGIFSLLFSVLRHVWRGFAVSARFLLNMSPPKDRQYASMAYERVQQLEVWTPGEFETVLFSTYSPVHAWLWMALTSANWILMGVIMVLVSVQVCGLVSECVLCINCLLDSCFGQVVRSAPEGPCHHLCRGSA